MLRSSVNLQTLVFGRLSGAILHNIHEVRQTCIHWYFGCFSCGILIKITKLFKLTKFCLFEDSHVLYYIKVTKFVKLSNFGIYEDFLVLYCINITKFVKIAYIGILEDYRVL